jgi:hypothetical protein
MLKKRMFYSIYLPGLFLATSLLAWPAFGADAQPSSKEVQAMKEGLSLIDPADIIAEIGMPRLGGYEVNEPLIGSDNEGGLAVSSAEVQAMAEGREVIRQTEALGDTGKPGLGGDKPNHPWFMPDNTGDNSASTSKSGKML